MALKKDLQTRFGTTASYWNIYSIQSNFANQVVKIQLFGYFNKKSRYDNAEPMQSVDIVLDGENYIAEPTRREIYDLLKAKPDFLGSEDI